MGVTIGNVRTHIQWVPVLGCDLVNESGKAAYFVTDRRTLVFSMLRQAVLAISEWQVLILDL